MSFQAEFAQNKNNIHHPSYEFMTTATPFFVWRGGGGGGGWDEKNAPYPVCTQHCIRLSRVLGMLTSELKNVTETVM